MRACGQDLLWLALRQAGLVVFAVLLARPSSLLVFAALLARPGSGFRVASRRGQRSFGFISTAIMNRRSDLASQVCLSNASSSRANFTIKIQGTLCMHLWPLPRDSQANLLGHTTSTDPQQKHSRISLGDKLSRHIC